LEKNKSERKFLKRLDDREREQKESRKRAEREQKESRKRVRITAQVSEQVSQQVYTNTQVSDIR